MIKKIRFIDLNLPSGILWGDRNLNNLYYQWGDLKGYSKSQIGKEKIFDWDYYKFNKKDMIIKYNHSDGLKELLPEDDIVTQTLGKNYRIPRKEDFEELLKYTDKIYNNNSVIFKSKVNKNQIIFPLLGFVDRSSFNYGDFCSFWSSSIFEVSPIYTWILHVSGGGKYVKLYKNSRYYGCVIRPVYDKEKIKYKQNVRSKTSNSI